MSLQSVEDTELKSFKKKSLTDEESKSIDLDEDEEEDSLNFGDSVASVTENISRVRLTLEEIIANDNETSRQQYMQFLTVSDEKDSLNDDRSSVSSTFESDTASFVSTSSGIRTGGLDNSSSVLIWNFNDPFQGVDDEDFENLDRYGFMKSSLKSQSGTIGEKEFMERERIKM